MKTDPKLPDTVEKSPEQLLAPFAKGRIVQWMVIAVILHVLLIGGTSMGYIRDRWIDPEGADKRKAAALAAIEAAKPKPKAPPKAAVTPTPATNAAPVAANTAVKPVEDNRNNTPIVKKITTTATTNEIPKTPDDLDINLNDTNRK